MILARKMLDWAGRKLGRDDGAASGGPEPVGPAPAAIPETAAAPEPAVSEGMAGPAPSQARQAEAGTGGAGPERDAVVDALRTVYDPEIPVNIYELGLVYDVRIGKEGEVEIDMTLTAPGCPVAGEMPGMVEEAVGSVPGVRSVKVELVWDPPWEPSRMSEIARLETGMF